MTLLTAERERDMRRFTLDAVLPARESWGTKSRPRYEATLFGPRKRPTTPRHRWIRHLRTTTPEASPESSPVSLSVQEGQGEELGAIRDGRVEEGRNE